MKIFFTPILFLISFTCFAQKHRTGIELMGGVQFQTKGLGMNGTGMGVSGAFIVFPDKKFQPVAEAGTGFFFGDKLYMIPDEGRINQSPVDRYLHAGIRYMPVRHLVLSLLAGVDRYSFRMPGFRNEGGFTARVSFYPGQNKRLITSLFLHQIPGAFYPIRFWGLNLGLRLS